MNKKGSHVGVILSFVIFIISVTIIYALIGTPFHAKTDTSDSFTFLKSKIMSELTKEIYVFRLANLPTENYLEISLPSTNFANPQSFGKDENGIEIASTVYEGNLQFLPTTSGFLKIYYSNNSFENEISLTPQTCQITIPKSVSKEKRITERKILNLLNDTRYKYDETKIKLDVALSEEFNLLFEYSNGTIIGQEKNEIKGDVYAQSVPVNYLSLKAEEKFGKLIIKKW